MLAAQGNQRVDLVQTGVLGQGLGYDLHGVGEGLDGQLLPATDGCCILSETKRQLYLWSAAAGNEHLVLHYDPHHPQGIFHRSVQLIHYVLSASSQDDGDRLGVLAFLDKGHLLVADLSLLDQACSSQILLRQVMDAGDNPAASGASQLLHVALLDPAHSVDPLFGQEVLGQIIDALLAEYHIGTGLDYVVHHSLEHALFLIQEGLKLIWGCDLYLGIDLGLLDLNGRIEQGDLGPSYLLWHIGVEPVLVDDHAVNQLGVSYPSSYLLLHGDVIGVHRAVLIHHGLNCLHGQRGKLLSGGP